MITMVMIMIAMMVLINCDVLIVSRIGSIMVEMVKLMTMLVIYLVQLHG